MMDYCSSSNVVMTMAVLMTAIYTNSEWVENKGLWYYISRYEQPADYTEANDICDALNHAHLAVITHEEQNAFLHGVINDNELRWIGLSSNKSLQHKKYDKPSQCGKSHLVWDKDWRCDNSFTSFDKDPSFNTNDVQCTGVFVSNGKWDISDCQTKHGFICQWECKEFYLHIPNSSFSGTYMFSQYYNRNIEYRRHNETTLFTIFWSTPRDLWVIKTFEPIYHSVAKSYVPYGKSIHWIHKNNKKVPVKSATFCSECHNLNITFNNQTYTMSKNTEKGVPPYYANDGGNVLIQMFVQWTENVTLGVCVVEDVSCQNWCGNLFPYPRRNTHVTLYNGQRLGQRLEVTHLCVSDKYVNSENDAPGSPIAEIICSTITPLAIILVVSLFVFLKSRKSKYNLTCCLKLGNDTFTSRKIKHHTNDKERHEECHSYEYVLERNPPRTNEYINPDIHQGDNDQYSYIPVIPIDKIPNQRLYDMSSVQDSNKNTDTVHYSYAGHKKTSTPQQQNVPSSEDNANRYFASDYGLLMEKENSSSPAPAGVSKPVVLPEIEHTCEDDTPGTVEKSDYNLDSGHDLQLHENEIYVPLNDEN